MPQNPRSKFATITILLLAITVMLLTFVFRRSIMMQNRLETMLERHQQAVNYVMNHTDEDTFGVLSEDTAHKGNLRMVSAQAIEEEGNLTTFIDEDGALWSVKDLMPISDNDVVLLWIVDNNTRKDTTDDEVVRVFIEAHKAKD